MKNIERTVNLNQLDLDNMNKVVKNISQQVDIDADCFLYLYYVYSNKTHMIMYSTNPIESKGWIFITNSKRADTVQSETQIDLANTWLNLLNSKF